MTIAACYVLPEGVILGADSTVAAPVTSDGFHHFNNAQKVFELGENATLGVTVWGLGGLKSLSYRTLFALLADSLVEDPPQSVEQVAKRWIDQFWPNYASTLKQEIRRCRDLNTKAEYDAGGSSAANQRTHAEEEEFRHLRLGYSVGFCIAGYVEGNRLPSGYEIEFSPTSGKPRPQKILTGQCKFYGAPNIIVRLINGYDRKIVEDVVRSGKWNGDRKELDLIFNRYRLVRNATPPVRDAIDFVYSCIYGTIKAMKFSSLPQICGGPIEVAVITSDRRFRWVRHKSWHGAITREIYDGGT